MVLYTMLEYSSLVLLPYRTIKVIKAWQQDIPGPMLGKLTSLYSHYYLVQGKFHIFMRELHQKYGPVVQFAPNMISTINKEDIGEIYKTYRYERSSFYHAFRFGGDNVVTSTAREAHAKRKKLLFKFYNPNNMTYVADMLNNIGIAPLIKELKNNISEDNVVDLNLKFYHTFYDTTGTLVFGNCFKAIKKEQYNFSNWLKETEAYCVVTYMFPVLRLIANRLGKLSYDAVMKFCDDVITEYRKSPQEYQDTCIMNVVLDHRDSEDGEPIHECDIRSELVGHWIASADALINSLTWFFKNLLDHQEVMDQIQKELDAAFPDKNTEIIVNVIEKQCPLLVASFYEILRMYPAASGFLPRIPPVGGISLSGYHVSRPMICGVNSFAYHRSPLHWDSPDSFRPHRFLGPDKADARSAMMSFSSGPTGCIGREIAWLSLFLYAAHLLRTFNLTKATPTLSFSHNCYLALKANDRSLLIRLELRD